MNKPKRESTSLAKVTRPGASGIFARERLFRELDRMGERPMIWVSGPAGSGKTTLVSSYLEIRNLPCLWYQLDESDTDLATFFYYMGLAAKQAAGRKIKPLPLLTPEYLPGLSAFALRYFESLCNRLTMPCALVLDNYHEVGSDTAFNQVINRGLSMIPKAYPVIFVSRQAPPPALTRMLATGQMEILDWRDIRLTREETQAIADVHIGERLPRGAVAKLHQMTDGWAAGLVLALQNARQEGIDPQRWIGSTPDNIFDYFASEVFTALEQPVKDFLLKTALLPNMTPQMAAALTGMTRAERLLSGFYRSHLFTQKRSHNGHSYQYHPLFRAFLLSRAGETYSEQELSALRTRAAETLAYADEAKAAIELFCDARDWDGAIALIMKHAPAMLAQGRHASLEALIGRLPEQVLIDVPMLTFWLGSCRLPFDPPDGQRIFEKAFEYFRSQGDCQGIFLSWAGIVDAIYFSCQDYAQFDQWIEVLEALLREYESFPSEEIEARVVCSMFTALSNRQPQHPEIEVWAQRTFQVARATTDMRAKIFALTQLLMHYVIKGDYEKGSLVFGAMESVGQSWEAEPDVWFMRKILETKYFLLTGDHQACAKASSQGLSLSRKTGYHLFNAYFFGLHIWSALNSGDGQTARALVKQFADLVAGAHPFAVSLYHFACSREAFFRKDWGQAARHAEITLKIVLKMGFPSVLQHCQLAKAQVMHELGRRREAQDQLNEALALAEQIQSDLLTFDALCLKAHMALDHGQRDAACAALGRALALDHGRGHLNPLVVQPAAMARLCALALEEGIEVASAQAIARKCKLAPDRAQLPLENWPWPVEIVTLGRFTITADGSRVRFSGKAQKKPLEMLKALIALGGREVPRSHLADQLWPEAEGDKANQSFATNLYRLRKLLGGEAVLRLREGRLSLSPRHCWVDAWVFERFLDRVTSGSWEDDNGRADAIDLLARAADLYRGPFLDDDLNLPWIIAYRERLRSKFIRCLVLQGAYLQKAGDLERAIVCFQCGLEKDNLSEVLYQQLISCLIQAGRRTEAESVYRQCQTLFAAHLEREPSKETAALL